MTNNTVDAAQILTALHEQCDHALKRALPELNKQPNRLLEAMHYAVFNGGKRLRPMLVFATASSFTDDLTALEPAAAAVELIHCYSLVHDDLPAMDDDDLRRGKPTCHKAFDEATAILVGDALQSLAFEVLSHSSITAQTLIQMQRLLAKASGALGMAGGQSLDLCAENQTINLQQLQNIHRLKTGALIEASVMLGALGAGLNDTTLLKSLSQFAQLMGLAFQIQDDILDVEGNTHVLGKTAGQDAQHHKATYPAIMGLSAAKKELAIVSEQAMMILNDLPFSTTLLKNLSLKLIQRNH